MPDPSAADVIAGFVKDVSDTVNNVENIADKIDGDRTVACELDNNTKLTFNLASSNFDHGNFSDPLPKAVIPQESFDVFGSADTGFNTGVEGRSIYESNQADVLMRLQIHWDNPFIGGNSCDAWLNAHNSHLFKVDKVCGSGNKGAKMRFTIAHATGRFKIMNKASNLLLDIPDLSHDNGTLLQQYESNHGENQIFRFIPIDEHYYMIMNENSLKVLDVPLDDRVDKEGTTIQQFTINQGKNQQWRLRCLGTGPAVSFIAFPALELFTIENAQSGLILDVPNGQKTKAFIGQSRNNGGDNQKWIILPA